MAGLLTPRPRQPRPERPGRGRPGRPLRPVRLADRAARRGLERAGRLGRRGRRRTTRRSRRTTWPGPGARHIRAERLPDRLAPAIAPAARRRPPGPDRPRPARPHRLRARRLAQGARDPARRGPAVRLGRRRDRPPEGGPRGRARPSATTRCRSSCRAIGSSGRTARSASTRSAGRRTSGRSWRPRASTCRSMERLASSGVRFIGSDTTKIFCLPTCRHARRVTDRHRLEFRSMAEGQARGYRACLVCRPASGVRRLRPPSRRARQRRCSIRTGHRNPRMPILRLPWTIPYANRRAAVRAARGALRSGSGCSSCTSCGARPTSAIAIAVETIPPFLMAAVRFLLAGPDPADLVDRARAAASFVVADPARVARQRDRRGAAARRRDGLRRLRRADRPVGHHRAAHRDDAGLGRRSSAASSSASGCRAWRSSGSSSASSASRSSSAHRRSAATGALDPLGLVGCPALADRLGDRLAVRLASGRPAGRPLVATGAPDGPRRARPGGHGARSTGELASFDLGAVTRDSLIAFAAT